MSRPTIRLARSSRAHRRSSSSSSACTSIPHQLSSNHSKFGSTRPTQRSRTSKTALIGHLSRQLVKEKREAQRTLTEKDEEIARLTADQSSRRAEAQKLFDSLDTLLFLGAPSFPQTVPIPLPVPGEAEELSSGPSHPRPRDSIFAHPSLVAAAAHSRSRSGGPPDRAETLGLEDEVRDLENEIARLNADRSRLALDAQASTIAEPDPTGDRQSLLTTVDELNAQVQRLQAELREAKNERAALRQAVEKYERAQRLHHDLPGESLLAKVEDLEAERNRLSHLLHQSEAECASLSSQLTATHSSIDALSLRIRRKLEEQKDKLRRAYEECEEWAMRADEAEGEAQELRGIVGEYERGMATGAKRGRQGESGSGGSID
ncbi:hypothetical protein JCM11251_006083 [Rhodosporidiobolus azoricus]